MSVFSGIFMAFGLVSKPAAGEEVVVSALAFTVLAWLVTRPGARVFAWLATAATAGAMFQQWATDERWCWWAEGPSTSTFAAACAPLAVVLAGATRARAAIRPTPPPALDIAVSALIVSTSAIGVLGIGSVERRADLTHVAYGAFAIGSLATVLAALRFGRPLLVLLLCVAVGTVAALDDAIVPKMFGTTDHMVINFFWIVSAIAVLTVCLVTVRDAATRTAIELDQIDVAMSMIAKVATFTALSAIGTAVLVFFGGGSAVGPIAGGITLIFALCTARTFARIRPTLELATLAAT